MLTLRSIFLYLDRTHVMQTANKSLWDMGLTIFRSHLGRRPEVARKTVQGLLTLIEHERTGDQVCERIRCRIRVSPASFSTQSPRRPRIHLP
jgi:hypothetical protein